MRVREEEFNAKESDYINNYRDYIIKKQRMLEKEKEISGIIYNYKYTTGLICKFNLCLYNNILKQQAFNTLKANTQTKYLLKRISDLDRTQENYNNLILKTKKINKKMEFYTGWTPYFVGSVAFFVGVILYTI